MTFAEVLDWCKKNQAERARRLSRQGYLDFASRTQKLPAAPTDDAIFTGISRCRN